MRSRLQLIRMWQNDPNMRELINSLWRDMPGLYNEKFDQDPEKWKRNRFAYDADFGQTLGQDNLIEGNRSIAIGQGLNTKSFMEILMGDYSARPEGENPDPNAWNILDLLFALGNGVDADNLHNAIEVYKSGLVKLTNALKIGAYAHGTIDPDDGILQYTQSGLFLRHLNAWISIMGKSAYQIAVDNGFVGTEIEWLASLVGADGNDGREIEMSVVGGWLCERYVGDANWTQLYQVPAADNSVVVRIDFQSLDAFEYTCPVALKFTSQTSESTAATLSVALNTNMAQFDTMTVTPTALGLVILTGEQL